MPKEVSSKINIPPDFSIYLAVDEYDSQIFILFNTPVPAVTLEC